MTNYDSRPDTELHIGRVQALMGQIVGLLNDRMLVHDASKLLEPEKSGFDEWTPRLRVLTYGSDEYKAALVGLGEALAHHYAHNRHHPEYHERGVDNMTLLDLVEMFADWKAATERHENGDLARSIEINRNRFGINPQLARIFDNTQRELGW